MAELKNPTLCTNDYVFIEFGRFEIDHDGFGAYQPLRCVYDGRYKLTINLMTSDELYDMRKDSGEMHNLILEEEYEIIRNHLHDILLIHMNETRDPFRGYYWECRPWRNDAENPTWKYTAYTRQKEEDPRFESHQLDYNTGLEMKEAVRYKNA